MSANRLMGPRETMEIILCQYEDDRIFYQFNGMDGTPCAPHRIHRLLTTVANALIQPTDGIVAPNPVTEPIPHLLPEDTHE